ncbi:MAG: hypothetical protein V3W28_00865 [Thermoplasmata archaeon]
MDERILATLRLFRDWGHAPTLEQLSAFLLGGREGIPVLGARLDVMEEPVVEGGIIGLAGWEHLIKKTERRLRTNRTLKEKYLRLAEAFCRDLAASCPFVHSVALAGSLATDGFAPGDDIDFDLFVDTGTRYTTYLLATLIGIRYAWRHRHRVSSEVHRTPVLPKITCVNVVWSEDQTRPFQRQDDALAFELMRCQPLYGVDHFSRVLGNNRWISAYFPQMFERVFEERVQARRNTLGGFLAALGRRPLLLRLTEAASRGVAWMIYSFVQRVRNKNPEAAARMEFLRRVKQPYEVFQD